MINYAQISWTPLDVQSVKPTWPLDKCESWLKENQKYIQGRLIEVGHEVISDLISSSESEIKALEMYDGFENIKNEDE
jgi:hypothetical protein